MTQASEVSHAWPLFRVPMAIALSSMIGLIAALTGDGWLDVLSWLTLAVPLLVVLSAIYR